MNQTFTDLITGSAVGNYKIIDHFPYIAFSFISLITILFIFVMIKRKKNE